MASCSTYSLYPHHFRLDNAVLQLYWREPVASIDKNPMFDYRKFLKFNGKKSTYNRSRYFQSNGEFLHKFIFDKHEIPQKYLLEVWKIVVAIVYMNWKWNKTINWSNGRSLILNLPQIIIFVLVDSHFQCNQYILYTSIYLRHVCVCFMHAIIN